MPKNLLYYSISQPFATMMVAGVSAEHVNTALFLYPCLFLVCGEYRMPAALGPSLPIIRIKQGRSAIDYQTLDESIDIVLLRQRTRHL